MKSSRKPQRPSHRPRSKRGTSRRHARTGDGASTRRQSSPSAGPGRTTATRATPTSRKAAGRSPKPSAPGSTTSTATPLPNDGCSLNETQTSVLVCGLSELKLIAERVVDVPALYERVCRQLREFDVLGSIDETPDSVILTNVGGVLIIKMISFSNQGAADEAWPRLQAVMGL